MSQAGTSFPPHSGSLLRTTLEHFDWTRAAETESDYAQRNAAMAKLTRTRPKKWLDMQQVHDLAVARVDCRTLLDKVPPT